MSQAAPKDNNTESETTKTGVQLLEVSEHAEGQRVDNFLMSRLKGLPKSHLYRLIRKGEIRVNKKRCKPDSRLCRGDIVRVAPLRLSETEPAAAPGPGLIRLLQDNVLFEDDYLMVLNKPAGVAVHAGSGFRVGVIEALRHMAGEGEFRELVHRLDKDTSGCLMVAKSGQALKTMQAGLKQRDMSKTYQALVHGPWPEQLTVIDVALRRHQPNEAERVVTVDPDGKPSLTRFRVLQQFSAATLIEAMPITGRTHQIRVHCQYAGHPIIGDTRYTYHKTHDFTAVRHLNLHAAALSFTHPVTGEPIQVQAPVSGNMQALISRLGGRQ
jgi:23S rRNA pseudouridine955/2504/2580 synthase